MTIERITIEPRDGGFRAYGWGVYPESSVLAGQPLRQYICEEPTVAGCHAHIASSQYGRLRLRVEVLDHATSKPYVSLAHLPGEDDPVPGGMYPDDIGEWPPEN